jgi:hypothetical protein
MPLWKEMPQVHSHNKHPNLTVLRANISLLQRFWKLTK